MEQQQKPPESPVQYPVPYLSRLGHELETHQTIVFRGTVIQNAQHFELSLMCGPLSDKPDEQPDIAMQVCFHFEVGITVLNSLLGGDWGDEEFHSNPFFHGKPFDVRLRVLEHHFQLLVGHRPWATFQHRIDPKQITHVQASGDIILSGVHLGGGHLYDLPYEVRFHGHALESGQRVLISGFPSGDFTISLVGANKDKLFQLGANFNKRKVLRNAQKSGDWGVEESEGPFPFHKNECFDLSILNDPLALQITINDQALPPFYHRTDDPHKDYKLLRIDGQLELTGVELSLCWETIGGAANCCKFPEGVEKAKDHVRRLDVTR